MPSTIPTELAGRSFDCDFGALVPQLRFREDGLRVILSAPDFAIDEDVEVDVATIRPGVFAMSWLERNGNFIVQVQDHTNGLVHNHARLADGTLFRAQGILRPVVDA